MNIEFINKFKKVMNGQDVVLFKNAFPHVITFNEFLEYRPKLNEFSRPTRWQNNNTLSVDFEVEGSPIVSENVNFFNFRANLFEVWGNELWDEPAFIMSEDVGPNSGLLRHHDPCEQIHWNCVGSSLWKVYNNGEEYQYILEPGDVIFLPDGIEHLVESLTSPRAGIAYSIDRKGLRENIKNNK